MLLAASDAHVDGAHVLVFDALTGASRNDQYRSTFACIGAESIVGVTTARLARVGGDEDGTARLVPAFASSVERAGSPYFFKLTGPAATVRGARPAFDALVESVVPSTKPL